MNAGGEYEYFMCFWADGGNVRGGGGGGGRSFGGDHSRCTGGHVEWGCHLSFSITG